MRNILTYSEHARMKEDVIQKIKKNDVNDEEAQTVTQGLPQADNYQSRLLKLIPTEVVGVYIFINGLLPEGIDGQKKYLVLQWAILGILFFINPLYLWYVSNVTNKKQLVICTIGFAVWAFSLNSSFMTIGGDKSFTQVLSSITLALYTLIVPMFLNDKKLK